MPPALIPWIEANQGLLSLSLSAAALFAAGGVALIEHRRAKRAETEAAAAKAARIREPAAAALVLLDELAAHYERAKTDENAAHEAAAFSARIAPPLRAFVSASIPSAPLLLALHDAAEHVATLGRLIPVFDNDAARARSCENRLRELAPHRAAIAKHAG